MKDPVQLGYEDAQNNYNAAMKSMNQDVLKRCSVCGGALPAESMSGRAALMCSCHQENKSNNTDVLKRFDARFAHSRQTCAGYIAQGESCGCYVGSLKAFLTEALEAQEKELLEMIEGMKKQQVGEDGRYIEPSVKTLHYNLALSDLRKRLLDN